MSLSSLPTETNAPAQEASLLHRSAQWLSSRSELVFNAVLVITMCVAVAEWFCSILAPLWLDETISYWQISGGLWHIWERLGVSAPAYSYILLAATKILGSSEVALRVPSVLAMLGAVVFFYLIAKELFDRRTAVVATVVFCLHPIVAFAAVDARPYAMAVLVVNGAIFSLLRWLKIKSMSHAVCFGVATAGIFYFQYLFSIILLVFSIIIIYQNRGNWRSVFPTLAAAVAVFAVAILPVVSRLVYVTATRKTHVFVDAPQLITILSIVVLNSTLFIPLLLLVLTVALVENNKLRENRCLNAGLVSLLLAAVPLGILFCVSRFTYIHLFIGRYCLVAIPGLALCWGWVYNSLNSKDLRLLFCFWLMIVSLINLKSTLHEEHGVTWKFALAAADANAARDNAPLLICSDLVEADFETAPADPGSSLLFAPLSYYRVNASVVPLPRSFNTTARSQIQRFLSAATPARKRFLMLTFEPSAAAVHWTMEATKGSYEARELHVHGHVSVVEFTPQ